MRFGTRVLTTLGSQVLVLAVSLLSSTILTRGLGPAGQGVYSLALQTCSFAVLLCGLGVDLGVVYFTSKGIFTRQKLASLWWFGLFWGSLVASITFWVALYLRDSVLQGVPATVLLVSVLAIPFMLNLGYQQSYLWGRNRLAAYNGVNLFLAFVLCSLQFLAVVGVRAGTSGAVGAYVAAHILTVGLVLKLTHAQAFRPSAVKDVLHVQSLIRFGLKGQLSNVLQFFSYRLDMFLLNMFFGNSYVGYYSVAVLLANAIGYIPGAISFVLLPYVAAGDRENAEYVMPIVCRNTLLLSLLAALALGALAPLIIKSLYSSLYLAAMVPLWLLLPGAVALSLDRPIASYQLGHGRPQISLYVTLLSTPVTLAAYLLLIPRFGIIGAAVASSISYGVTTIIELAFLFRFSSVRLGQIIVPRKSDWTLYRSSFMSAWGSLLRQSGRIG